MHTRSRHVVREWVLRRIASWDCLGKIIFTQFPVQRRNSPGPGPFSFMGRGLASIFGQFVSVRIRKLNNTNLVASSHIIKEKASLPVDVRRSEKTLFNLPNKRRQRPKKSPTVQFETTAIQCHKTPENGQSTIGKLHDNVIILLRP